MSQENASKESSAVAVLFQKAHAKAALLELLPSLAPGDALHIA